jgi:hypothetical protein
MASTNLVLVEGLPGSGKTSTAQYIHRWLSAQGRPAALYLEGDWSHPADFESVACLDAAAYADLLERFPGWAGWLEQQATAVRGERFYSYRRLQVEHGDRVPADLIAALAQYEVYELPAERYARLLRERWRTFTRAAAQSEVVTIFECCLLQNPLTMYLGRHAGPIAAAQALILDLAARVRELNPRLIYLDPGDIAAALRNVAATRPQAWLDFVIAYHTEQGCGRANGWQGFDGLVEFYRLRQSVELELLPQLPFPSLIVPHTDWDQDYARITTFLSH